MLSKLSGSIPNGTDNARLIQKACELNSSALTVATAENFAKVAEL